MATHEPPKDEYPIEPEKEQSSEGEPQSRPKDQPRDPHQQYLDGLDGM